MLGERLHVSARALGYNLVKIRLGAALSRFGKEEFLALSVGRDKILIRKGPCHKSVTPRFRKRDALGKRDEIALGICRKGICKALEAFPHKEIVSTALIMYKMLFKGVVVLLRVGFCHHFSAHSAHELICFLIKRGGFSAWRGYDKGSSRLVNKNRIDLVDNGEVIAPRHLVILALDEVIPQIVEAELAVHTVGNVGSVRLTLFILIVGARKKSYRKAEKAVYLSHFLHITPCEVFVYGDDMHTLAREGVEIRGHRGNEGFTLTRFHLGNSALMKYYRADKLDIKGALSKHAPVRLAYDGVGIGKNIVERLPLGKSFLEYIGHSPKLGIAHRRIFRRKSLNLIYRRLYFLYLLFTVASKKRTEKSHISLHSK